jgi:hypothetical protein
MLFYADGIRQAMWSWFFSKAPRGRIEIPDEDLNPEILRTDARKLTTVFLLTTGARVLRILDTDEARVSDTRSTSFSPSEESHGTTPSEVCSNLGISLAKVLQYSRPRIAPPGGVPIIDPSARSALRDYHEGATKTARDRVTDWILREFLPSEIDRLRYGTFSSGRAASLVPQNEEMVAINIRLLAVESEDSPVPARDEYHHAISAVRVNGSWNIADNDVGNLIPMRTSTGTSFSDEILSNLESPYEVYFECRYTYRQARDEFPEAQYFLRDLAGTVLASTPKIPMMMREPEPGVRPVERSLILREMYGVEVPGDAIILPEPRTNVYWKLPKSGRVVPPPDKSTGLLSTVGATGGKRKTKKKVKSKRRKTTRAGRARPSLPK